MKILRVFNNNVVLAKDGAREVIVTGRGLGFQAKPGQRVDDAKIVRVFVPADGRDPDHIAELLSEIPPEIIRLVTDAMTAFGLSADKAGHFADVLAQASSKSNTNVGMMGETFKYVAPVAGALGYSVEDAAVAIGLMANSGIKSSQAGTALRQTLTRLAKPTDEVEAAMEDLGISLTDSEGNMKSLGEVMLDMRKGFKNLTKDQQAQYAASIAGQEGMSGLLAIVNASDEDFNTLTKAIQNSDGAAQSMADTMQDNLKGAVTIAKSALEGLGITVYEEISTPMKNAVETATE